MLKWKRFPISSTIRIKWRITEKKTSCSCSSIQTLRKLNTMAQIFSQILSCYKRCCEQLVNDERSGEVVADPSMSNYRKPGNRKKIYSWCGTDFFEWFVDIRRTLKTWQPWKIFKTQCDLFHEQWLTQQNEVIPDDKKIVFSNLWIKNWMYEYGLSHPKKWFQINQAAREKRVFVYLWKFGVCVILL